MEKKMKLKENRTSSIVLHNVLIGVLAFIWLIPIVWLLCTSFSSYSGMNTSTFFPKEWSVAQYVKLFHPDTVAQFPQWFLNTFIIACFTCVISTMFVLMVAYATSVMRFPLRKPLLFWLRMWMKTVRLICRTHTISCCILLISPWALRLTGTI